MIGFHIDMNMAHYRVDYLRAWLAELARLGYDTVVWELENSVAWNSCPECAAPDALTTDELRALLTESRLHGLRPVPLLQTLGHAEYVLKHDAYRGLRELPDRIDQYCPRNPDVVSLLHRWIDEYLDVLGPIEYFHLGADESMCLGCCPECRSSVEEYSLSKLYVDHVNALARPLIKKGITPIIWADMILACPEAIDDLAREVMLFDWRYDIYRGCDRICLWPRARQREGDAYTFGQPMIAPAEMTEAERAVFGRYVFPSGDESEAEAFYTADFLAGKGFKVVTCPSSSHYGDNVFSPRDRLHAANVFDSFHKGIGDNLHGSVLTSWSVHLFPWELQAATIAIPRFVHTHTDEGLDQFREQFVAERFGKGGEGFWRACDLLSGQCLFTTTASLGFDKSCGDVPRTHVRDVFERIQRLGTVEAELERCRRRAAEYAQGLELLTAMQATVRRGHTLINVWKLAARNLMNRAEVSSFLLSHVGEVLGESGLPPSVAQRARILLGRIRMIRAETDAFYDRAIRPHRKALIMQYLYGSIEDALQDLVQR